MKSSHGVMGNLQSRGSHAHDPCSNNSCSWQPFIDTDNNNDNNNNHDKKI